MNIPRFHKYYLLQDVPPDQIESFVRENAQSVIAALQFDQPLTEEGLAEFRKSFADEAIELNKAKGILDKERKALGKQIKDIEKEMQRKLGFIESGIIKRQEMAFMFPDHANKKMVAVDVEGQVLHVRDLKDEELQLSIKDNVVRDLNRGPVKKAKKGKEDQE